MNMIDFGFYFGILGSFASLIALITVYPILKWRISGYFSNTKFVIIGAPGSGKTSLLRFMQGKLPPKIHIRTPGIEEIEYVNLNLGGTDQLHFQARIVRELGGEFSDNLAPTLLELNPNGIIILVDGQSDQEEGFVVLEFVKAMQRLFNEQALPKINLKTILIIINKYDLIGEASENVVINMFRRKYYNLFEFFDRKMPFVRVNLCCGSISEAQFLPPVEAGLRFLARGQ